MAAIQFTAADRDDQGFIKAPAEPRSLADLLPQITPPADPTIRRQPLTRFEMISACLVVPLLIGALLYFSSGRAAAPALAPPGTSVPAVPTITPAAPAPVVAMSPAFAAPDGLQLGTIEATRQITPIAHYGADWIQADVSGSGRIWLRASDWPSLAIVGPDLAPRPIAPAAPAPIYVAAPEPPPAPPQCAEAGIPGRMVSVCGEGDLDALAKAKWIETYGGNIGVVGHPTPQIKDTQ